jgi:cobalt-zinc-cadmium efflux system outer membrane protein
MRSLHVFLAIFLAAAPAGADPPPLTLQAALSEALAHNPELAALRAQLEADARRPEQERYLPPPMLEAQIWQWPLSTANPAGATYMFMAEQMIPGRGKRTLRERLLSAEFRVSAAAVPVRARDIASEVKRTYAELFVARKAEAVAGETIDLLRQIADAAQVRYAAGKTPQQDVLKAVLEISRLHDEQVMRRERARLAEARLNTLLGRPADGPVGALTEVREEATLPPVAELQHLAVESQPRLALARADIDRAQAAAALAHSDRKPDFTVRGGYMLMPGEAGAFTAAVGITWPNAPWARGRVASAVAQAQLDVTAARARYDAEATGVRLMVHEAWVRVQSASERAALLRTSLVPQSTQALDVARVGYQSDRGDFLDIIDNQRMLAEARLGYYAALADLEAARADLERAVGAPIGAAPAAAEGQE